MCRCCNMRVFHSHSELASAKLVTTGVMWKIDGRFEIGIQKPTPAIGKRCYTRFSRAHPIDEVEFVEWVVSGKLQFGCNSCVYKCHERLIIHRV